MPRSALPGYDPVASTDTEAIPSPEPSSTRSPPTAGETPTMPSVLSGPKLLRNQPGPFRTVLSAAGFELIEPDGGMALTHEQLKVFLPKTDALLAGGERMTPEMFAIAPRLRVIARSGVGYDLVDVKAATAHKVA